MLTLIDGISGAGTGLVLAYTPVPEPVVTGLIGMVAMGLVRRPRRSKKAVDGQKNA